MTQAVKKQSDRDESAVARDVSADTERCVLERIQRHLSKLFDWGNTRLRSVWRGLQAYTYIGTRQAQIFQKTFPAGVMSGKYDHDLN